MIAPPQPELTRADSVSAYPDPEAKPEPIGAVPAAPRQPPSFSELQGALTDSSEEDKSHAVEAWRDAVKRYGEEKTQWTPEDEANLNSFTEEEQKKIESGVKFTGTDKPYRHLADKILLDPQRPGEGLVQAHRDGVIEKPERDQLSNAFELQRQLGEQVAQQKLAGGNQELKAAGVGAGRGLAFLGGAIAGTKVGVLGTALIPVVGETGVAEFIGGGIGGIAGGMIAQAGYDELVEKNFESAIAASKLHPNITAGGELVSFAIPGVAGVAKGIRRFALVAENLGKEEALKQAAKYVAVSGGIGAASAPVMAAVDRWKNAALDLEHDPKASLFDPKSIAANTVLAIMLGNLGVKFKKFSAGEAASIHQRGMAGAKLSPAEREMFDTINRKLAKNPNSFVFEAEQATMGGKPLGGASAARTEANPVPPPSAAPPPTGATAGAAPPPRGAQGAGAQQQPPPRGSTPPPTSAPSRFSSQQEFNDFMAAARARGDSDAGGAAWARVNAQGRGKWFSEWYAGGKGDSETQWFANSVVNARSNSAHAEFVKQQQAGPSATGAAPEQSSGQRPSAPSGVSGSEQGQRGGVSESPRTGARVGSASPESSVATVAPEATKALGEAKAIGDSLLQSSGVESPVPATIAETGKAPAEAAQAPQEKLTAGVAIPGVVYQGISLGLHAFKDLSTGGNFSVPSKDIDNKTAEEAKQIIADKAEKVRSSFAAPAPAAEPPRPGASGEAAPARVTPAKLTREVKSDSGYVYHATNEERLGEIVDSGQLDPHAPDYGTDQSEWPDGSTHDRSYFSRKANVVWQFAPEDGKPVVIRTKEGPHLKTESTGDVYSRKSIPASELEYLGEDGNWHPVADPAPKAPAEPASAAATPEAVFHDPKMPFITAIIHPSARQKGLWQGTVMGPEGPAQHIEAATRAEIVKSLTESGFKEGPPPAAPEPAPVAGGGAGAGAPVGTKVGREGYVWEKRDDGWYFIDKDGNATRQQKADAWAEKQLKKPEKGVRVVKPEPPPAGASEGPGAAAMEAEATHMKRKLDADESGGIPASIFEDVADFGKRVFRKGMDFARWAAEMIRYLGEKVAAGLRKIWDSYKGSIYSDETGALFGKNRRARGRQPDALPQEERFLTTQGFYEGSADVFLKEPTFRQLGKAINRQVDLADKRLGDTTGKLEAWESRTKSADQKTAKATLSDYIAAREDGRAADAATILAGASTSAKDLIKTVGDIAEYTGKVSTTLVQPNGRVGVEVMASAPTGPRGGIQTTIRPLRNLGREFWPRILTGDYEAVLRDPLSDPAKWQQMIADLVANGNAATPAEAEQFLKGGSDNEADNQFLGSLYRGRGKDRMPAHWYDTSLEGFEDWAVKWSDIVSKIEAFNQKIRPNDKDAFDEALALTTHRPTQSFINSVASRAYNERNVGTASKYLLDAPRIAASGLFLTNPITIGINALSSKVMNTFTYGLAANVARNPLAMFSKKNHLDAFALGVLKRDMVRLLYRDDVPGLDTLKNFANGAMNISGYTAIENLTRVDSYLTALSFLHDGLAAVRRNPTGRGAMQFMAFVKRNGYDVGSLIKENGTGDTTDTFLRGTIRDTQGGYAYNQVPWWTDTPLGRFLLQFSKFSTMHTRNVMRNVIQPAFVGTRVSIKVGGKTVSKRVFNVKPLLYFLAGTVLGGEAISLLKEKAFGIERRDSTMTEIANAMDENTRHGLVLLAVRALNDSLTMGMLGVFGTPIQSFKDVSERTKMRNPLAPPGVSLFTNLGNLIQSGWEQGKITAGDVTDFLKSSVSMYRYADAFVKEQSKNAGLKWQAAELKSKEDDASFIRSASKRYANDAGLESGRATSAGRTAKNESTPMRQDLMDALLVGNQDEAKKVVTDYLQKFPSIAEKKEKLRSLQQSVEAHQPIKVGGIAGNERRIGFMDWAKKHLSPADVARISSVDNIYRSTANAVGLMGTFGQRQENTLLRKESIDRQRKVQVASAEQEKQFLERMLQPQRRK